VVEASTSRSRTRTPPSARCAPPAISCSTARSAAPARRPRPGIS
jgi:hypothetical protein